MSFLFSSAPKFDQSKFKVLLQLSLNRLQLQKRKAVAAADAHKREIADLLRGGQEEKARVRAIAVIMDDYTAEVLNQLSVYVNTLHSRLELLLSQKTCPPDLKESCCAIVFAAPYLADQLELSKCRTMLLARFGKGFPDACADCNAVSPKIVSRLQPKSPDAALVNYYISSIAKEHEIAGWEPPTPPADDVQPLPVLPTAAPRTDASKCVAYGPGLVDGTSTMPSHFTIEARDTTGARSTTGGDKFAVYVSGPENTRIYGTVADNGDGTYSALYTPPLPGAYAIAIHLEQTPIGTGEPWTVFVRGPERPADAAMCRAIGPGLDGGFVGERGEFTIVACDATGQQRSVGGDEFHVYVAGPQNTRIFGEVQDNGDGTYTASYVPPIAGGYAIAVHLGRTPIGDGRPFELFVEERIAEQPPADDDDDELMKRFNALAATPVVDTPPPAAAPVVMPASKRAVVVQKPVGQAPAASAVAAPAKATAAVAPRRGSGLNASMLSAAVVLDNGSGLIKCGLGGDPLPTAVFPTVVGRPMYQSAMPTMGRQDIFVGDEARRKKGVLALRYPISHGVVQDWSDMEALWTHSMFNELRIDPTERPVLLTEQPLNTRANREKAAEIMFESFRVPGFFIADSSALSLRASGRSTGVVLDAGDGVCHAVPVVDGVPLRHAVSRLEIGGRDLTAYLIKLLTEDGVFLGSTSSERDIAMDIKETVGYVAMDFHSERSRPADDVSASYRMPDAELVNVSYSRFACAEPLFDPHLLGKDTPGVTRMVADSVELSDDANRARIAATVLLAGGSTMFQGFKERVQFELGSMLQSAFDVVAPEDRKFSSWIGGAALAGQHEAFCDICVAKAEYDEKGVACAHRF